MKPLSQVSYLSLSKIKTFSTHFKLGVLINYYQEVKIYPISIIDYQ